jgi:hypothetical protein
VHADRRKSHVGAPVHLVRSGKPWRPDRGALRDCCRPDQGRAAGQRGGGRRQVRQVIGRGSGLWTAIAVAVLKYRLYDIDRVISRTLAYAIVTGLLAGVYAALVLLTTEVFRFHSTVAVAAATLAAAALFNPLRRRVQQVVDRRFNRARYDAEQTVTAFAARLKDTVDLDSVLGDLATVVDQALQPAHLSLWISRQS